MERIICIICVCLLFSGCSWFQREVIVEKIVKTPVYVCPKELQTVHSPELPQLCIYNLSENDKVNPGKVVQCYKISVKQLQQHIEQQQSLINLHEKVCVFE